MRTVFIALLRGINVGTAKRAAMAELRAAVEELGYTEVRTLPNSGNVVFLAAKAALRELAVRIEKALKAKLGVSARVMVISAEELAEVVAGNPQGGRRWSSEGAKRREPAGEDRRQPLALDSGDPGGPRG